MTSLAEGWERPGWRPGGGDAFVSYALFGDIPARIAFPRVAADVPNLSIRRYTEADHPGVLARARGSDLLEGPDSGRATLAATVAAAPACALVLATVPDPRDLLYLRRVRHVVAAVLDAGARALLDGPTRIWWEPARWRSAILAPAETSIHDEVVVRTRPDAAAPGALELSTRGLRKFGRPDVVLRAVPAADRGEATAFARHLAGRLIRGMRVDADEPVPGPEGSRRLAATRAGGPDDPEYDNVHLDFLWA